MTATFHPLGSGRNAGLYYVNDPNREARPRNRDEYYASDGGGEWWSSGESVVRHGAAIDKNSFRDLCAGLHPGTGSGLVRGAGDRHRAGWDVTFSAPKSLSLLWAVGTDEQRASVEALHRRAVDAALRFVMRQQLLEVRLGAGGRVRQQATDVIVGRFQHTTSRAGDPNLHTHCVLMNVACSADGKHRTIEPDALFKWTHTVGAAYRAELAMLLAMGGFAMRPAGRDQIEICGIDKSLIETFSKRSQMIEAVVGDRDTASGARKELAALATRQSKEMLPTGAELEARWYEEFGAAREPLWHVALEAGRDQAHVGTQPDLGAAPSNLRLDPMPVAGDGPVAQAASQLLSHESVVDRRNVLRHGLVAASLRGIVIDAVEHELGALEADGSLQRLREGREAAWTTEHIAEREAAMVAACRRGVERAFFRPRAVADALEGAPHLSDEQRAAVEGAASRDGVSLVEAGAGTGKTTLASAIQNAAERSGLRVIGLAPTWQAADELRRSVGIPSYAVAKWRYDREGRASDGTAERGRASRIPQLDRRTLILLDEAGMLGTLDMAAVLTAARDAGAKVIAFGDRRQLQAVAQGSALAAVADELRRVETLSVIRRQRQPWQREASTALSEGRMADGLGAYQERGAIGFAKDAGTAITEAVRQWGELRSRHGTDVPIITRSNRDAALLNAAARQTLRENGELTGPDILVLSVDRRARTISLALAVGDQIRFGANLAEMGIRNGTRGSVLAITTGKDGEAATVRVRLETGREVESMWVDFAPPQRGSSPRPLPRVTHAYGGTVYSVQGRTAPAAVFYVGQRTDARETYVALTRHRDDVRIVVDSRPRA